MDMDSISSNGVRTALPDQSCCQANVKRESFSLSKAARAKFLLKAQRVGCECFEAVNEENGSLLILCGHGSAGSTQKRLKSLTAVFNN
jgi:hypothetical protein